jgi:GAF domain-containing protein
MPEVDSDLSVSVPKRGLLRRLASKVGEKALDHIVTLTVVAVLGGGLSIFVGLLRRATDHWVALTLVSAFLCLGAVIGLASALVKNIRNRLRTANRERVISQQRFRYVEYQKELIYNALESIQQALAIEEDWSLDQLVERGVIGPARGLLKRAPLEDVRVAVLIADEAGDRWKMRWAAGHRPEGVRNYHRPIDTTLAGQAYTKREIVVFDDVTAEADFIPNPRATREFRSLVAAPLLINEDIVGALSVVSTLPGAFTDDDVSFIRIVAALLDVLLAAELDVARAEDVDDLGISP